MFGFRSRPPPSSEPSPILIEPVAADFDLSPFLIRDASAIAATMQELVNDGSSLSLHGLAGGGLSGRIVGLQPDERLFTVEADGRVVPAAAVLQCVALLNGIKLQFQSRLVWHLQGDAMLTAIGEWPEELALLQRRSFPRRGIPVGQAFRAEFKWRGEARSMSVDDLSVGGIGLRGTVSEALGMNEGHQLQHVSLIRDEKLALVVDLEVRSSWRFRSFLAGQQVHLGCRFVDIDSIAMSELLRLLEELQKSRAKT